MKGCLISSLFSVYSFEKVVQTSPVRMIFKSKLILLVLIAFLHSDITLDFDFPAEKTLVIHKKVE